MKLKKLLTGFVAAAVAVSTFAISAFAATATLDSEYKGDWAQAGKITLEHLQEFIDMGVETGEYPYVKVVLDVEPINIDDKNDYIMKPMPGDKGWDAITSILSSDTAVAKPDGFMQIRKDQTKVEFVMPPSMLEEGWNTVLAFQVKNVIIKSAELSVAEGPQGEIGTVSEADTIAYCNYLGAYAVADEETTEETTEEDAAEEDAAEEETTEEDAAEEETTEEDVAEDDAAEEEAEDDAAAEEETEEDAAEDDEAALEPDWDSYDADAMAKMNEEFVLGGNIDIYAAVGDAWADIAKIEADFIWTPGLGGWCGGAGIGNGATLADGTAWISGPEYGAANANSKYEPDGKATQTLIDLSATPLATIATVGEDGVTAFGQLMVQNWWNGTEAGAQVAAIRFLDADGNVINELTYAVDAPAADDTTTEAPSTGDVDAETDSSKGSPDTGVEDVAVVAGLAIVAAGAVLVSKKRK